MLLFFSHIEVEKICEHEEHDIAGSLVYENTGVIDLMKSSEGFESFNSVWVEERR